MGSTWNSAGTYEFGGRSSYANEGPVPYHETPVTTGPGSAPQPAPPPMTNDPDFDILEWHPAYTSCQRYFLDHAQHEPATQALCALINIRLPFQWQSNAVASSTPPPPAPGLGASGGSFTFSPFPRATTASGTATGNVHSPIRSRSRIGSGHSPSAFVSLIPYIRRLIVTAFDKAPILHGFFGDDYVRGVLPHVDCERRNYLFAAKHGGWRTCKRQYDCGSGGGGDESVPFMKPLDEAKMEELTAAEKAWSSWLAMEDWMVGPRAPADDGASINSAYGAGRGGFGPSMDNREAFADGMRETGAGSGYGAR